MASTNLDTTKTTLAKNTITADLDLASTSTTTLVAVDGTDGGLFTPSRGTSKYLILAMNTHAATDTFTFTVLGSDGMFGGADLVSSAIVHAKSRLLAINDIGPYLIRTGANKGKIQIKVSDTSVKLAIIEMPA